MILETLKYKISLDDNKKRWERNISTIDSSFQKFNIDYVKSLKKDQFDTILDCGCNYGQNLLVYQEFAKKVYGFEMQTDVFDHCIETLKLNNITKCTVFNCALGNENKPQVFYKRLQNDAGSHIAKKGFEIAMKRIDDMNFDEKIDFIKIDVEGYEPQVLEGAINTIIKNKPIVQCEVVDILLKVQKNNSKMIFDFFKKLGYIATTRKGTVVDKPQNKFRDIFFIFKG